MIKAIIRKQMTSIVVFMAVVIFIVFTITSWINIRNAEVRRSETIFRQVETVLRENKKSLRTERISYRESCLGNARSVATILDAKPSARSDRNQLVQMCDDLQIDEIHIFNEQGVLIQGTQPEYYGYTFDSGEQMSFFKPMLNDRELELVQDVMPNTAAGKLEQYSAIWSKDKTYIVEIGMHPQRVIDYMERNELQYIFRLVGAGGDSALYSVDTTKNKVVVSTNSDDTGLSLSKVGLSASDIEKSDNGFFAQVHGKNIFGVSQKYGDEYLVRTISAWSMLRELMITELLLLISVLMVFVFLRQVVMTQLEGNVLTPIDKINSSLKAITNGEYSTRVEEQSTREFSELAEYVNEMTDSIQEHVATVHYQSRHDLLTGAWNRNALEVRLSYLRQQYGSAAVIYADLNGLKKINDEQGHDAGDQVIIELADSLTRIFGDEVVFRAGGDEFVIVDDTITEEEMYEKESLLRKEWDTVSHSVSTGGSFCEDTHAIDRHMIEADTAMYRSKREFYRSHQDLGVRSSDAAAPWKDRLEDLFEAFSIVANDRYVYLTDLEHDYSIWSRSAVDTFGMPSTHMINAGGIWEKHIHPDDREQFSKSIELIFNGQMDAHDMQYRAQELSGEYVMCTCRGLVMKDEQGKPKYFGGTIQNHSLKSSVDTLTGLMNQEGFFGELRSLIRNKENAVIMMMGLSNFSEVNTLYGYELGSRVLQKIARHFSDELANYGDYFRLDGTQSIIISHKATRGELEAKYEKLRRWAFEEIEEDGHKIPMRLNGGILDLDEFDVDDNTVFVCLSTAFQTSKRDKQGDLVYFNEAHGSDSQERVRKINTIRVSLSKGYEGFELFYQPIVDMKTERLAGAEALLRWRNKEFGFIPPDIFLPVLENDVQFYSLGLWILRQAMEDGVSMVKKNPDFALHINLSYTQVREMNFAEDVIRLIEETGIPAENVCLEITERCRLVNMKVLNSLIARLKSYGVKFALDDFGTGYSSANVLRDMDIDVVKVDKSFVRNVETDDVAVRAVGNIVELAAVYGAVTCIEGIENEAMRQILMQYPIETLQGYHYSKPIPMDLFCEKYEIEQ